MPMPDSTRPRLSALLCVHNEQARLEKCLNALHFADEIIVVLDRCTDDSKIIAEKAGAITIEGAWEREGPRRHAAIDAAKGDWLLEIDADELVPPALAEEILETIQKNSYDWHKIPFDNFIGGRLVKNGWGASFGVRAVGRLHKRDVKRWGDERVHPMVTFVGQEGPWLHHAIQHDVDDNVFDMVDRLNRYSELRAADLRDAWQINGHRQINGKNETLSRNLGRFFSRFYKCYIRRKGHKEKGWGFLIATLAGLYPLLSYMKATLEHDRGGANE